MSHFKGVVITSVARNLPLQLYGASAAGGFLPSVEMTGCEQMKQPSKGTYRAE
jgi:hypothetical protein